MSNMTDQSLQKPLDHLTQAGYAIVSDVISSSELATVVQGVSALACSKAGTRNALEHEWCQSIVHTIRRHPVIAPLLPAHAVAIQCIYFEKSAERNWRVPLHRDSIFPIKARVESANWGLWQVKEGHLYGRPPDVVLRNLVVVRLHLEANTATNGPLHVIPGSHRTCQTDGTRLPCLVPECGAMVFYPLLLHASSKVICGVRRVLHYVFAPAILPDGAEWAQVI